MDLKHLKAVVTVAEVGSVTRAAELLGLVQPAVTRQIRTLEEELGVALFTRTSRGMEVTEAGAIVVTRARRALNELVWARSEVRPAPRPAVVSGVVRVGLLESTTDLLAEPLVSALARDYPGVELRLVTAYSGYLQQWLDDGELDVSLLYNLDNAPSLNAHLLLHENLWAVAPASEGLRPDRPVPFATAVAHPLVMPASGHGLRTLIDKAAERAGLTIRVAAQTNSMSVQKLLVPAGHGWTILPAVGVAGDVADGVLSAAPLCEPALSRAVVVAAPRTSRIPPPMEVVARELIRLVLSAVDTGRWPVDATRPVPPPVNLHADAAPVSGEV